MSVWRCGRLLTVPCHGAWYKPFLATLPPVLTYVQAAVAAAKAGNHEEALTLYEHLFRQLKGEWTAAQEWEHSLRAA
jgi:hypothetical protein